MRFNVCDSGRRLREAIWGDIGNAFSKPVGSQDLLEYVPTQLMAAELQREGYDGIAYKSLLVKGGTNFVLFDPKAAAQTPNRCLYKTKCGSYEFARWDDDTAWKESIVSRYCYNHDARGADRP